MPKRAFTKSTPVYKPSAKDIFRSLECEYKWLDLLKGKPYEALIPVIKCEACKSEDETSDRFSVKALADAIGVTPGKVTTWLNKMYEDLMVLNDKSPELFGSNGQLYELSFKGYYEQTAYFKLWLDKPVNKGEPFQWDFMKAATGTYYFNVHHISHEFKGGKQASRIDLKAGMGNTYREMVLEKAKFHDLLSFDELYRLNDYELNRLLLTRVEGVRLSSFDSEDTYSSPVNVKSSSPTKSKKSEAPQRRKAKRING